MGQDQAALYTETDEETIRRRVRASYASGVLTCSMMQLSHIPGSMKPTMYAQLGCLVELYLADNRLTTLPVDFVRMVRTVKTLILKRNKITVMPPEIGVMTRLTKLDLSNNQLYRLPPTFSNLTNLAEVGPGVLGNPWEGGGGGCA